MKSTLDDLAEISKKWGTDQGVDPPLMECAVRSALCHEVSGDKLASSQLRFLRIWFTVQVRHECLMVSNSRATHSPHEALQPVDGDMRRRR